MENPTSWTAAHHVIDRAIREHEHGVREGVVGPSLPGAIFQALREEGLITGYPIVSPVVVGLVLPEPGKILTVRRSKDPKDGIALPGGYASPGETWQEALRREILEETNIEVSVDPEHMRVFEAHSTSNGARLLLFALIEKAGIVHINPFVENSEVSERMISNFSLTEAPSLCFPFHQRAMERYQVEHFGDYDSFQFPSIPMRRKSAR